MEKELKKVIKDVPDFPKKGIIFKDLTPIFQNKIIFKKLINYFYKHFKNKKIDKIACVEARGFLIGSALAYKLGVGLVPIRKPGKLPRDTYKVEYSLEYGKDALEMHKDAIKKGEKILIVDDLLATGGTVNAVAELVEKAGGKVVGIAFIVELDFLNGRKKLEKYNIFSIVHY